MTTESVSPLATQEHSKGILVVEDDVALRFALAEWFRLLRYRVYEAATADEAVALLNSSILIHLVITDIDMPGMLNGLDLVNFIEMGAPGTQVIVVSGQDQEIGEKDVLFFKKPYDLHEISLLISNMLQARPGIDLE